MAIFSLFGEPALCYENVFNPFISPLEHNRCVVAFPRCSGEL